MTVPIKSEVFADLRAEIANELTKQGFAVASSDDVEEVLWKWFNLQRLRIPSRVRGVEWSKELRAREQELSADQRSALADIEAASAAGKDLTPYLSRKVVGAKKKAEYNDGLRNDWGFHHMHLGRTLTPGGFIEGTEEVLWVKETSALLLFIEVGGHGESFADDRLFQIAHTNWPCLLRAVAWPGVGGEAPTPAERLSARASGVTMPSKGSDGKFYMPPGGGCMTNGLSAAVLSESDRLLTFLRDQELSIAKHSEEIVQGIAAKTGKQLGELHLKLSLIGGVVQLYEAQSMVALNERP